MLNREAVIYCRVSTAKQADKGTGLSLQLQDCLWFCQAQQINVVAAFSDVGSGNDYGLGKLKGREQACRIAAKRDAFIVCAESSRYSREGPERCKHFDWWCQGRILFARDTINEFQAGIFIQRHDPLRLLRTIAIPRSYREIIRDDLTDTATHQDGLVGLDAD